MLYGPHCNLCALKDKSDPYPIAPKQRGGDPRFLIVTSPPSHHIESYGRLIAAAPAKLLGGLLEGENFHKEEFLFYPSVRCPHDPDKYTNKEKSDIAKCCRPYIVNVINSMKPEAVIPIGVDAAKQVIGHPVKIMKVRGQPSYAQDLPGVTVLPMINPYMAVAYPQHVPTLRADIATLGRLVDNNYDLSEVSKAVTGDYKIIDDLQFLIDADPEVIAYDTENTGLSWFAPDAAILTMQFCIEPGVAYLLPWDHPDAPQTQRAKARLRRQLRQLLARRHRIVIGQNSKYDAVYTYAHTGVRYAVGGDTLMLAAILDENATTKNLDDLIKRYVPAMAGYADEFNATIDKSRMRDVPLDAKFIAYACGDADAVFRLDQVLYPKMAKDPKLLAHYNHVTLPGLNAFSGIELRGLIVDDDEVDAFEEFMSAREEEAYQDLLAQVPKSIKRKHLDSAKKIQGNPLAFSRPLFVLDILFYHPDGFCLKPKVFTKGTAKLDANRRIPSTSTKDHLPYFYEECPFTYQLSEYIKLSRILTANVQGFRKKYIVDQMVRPTYNMHVAVTGRTACVKDDTPIVTLRGVVRADSVVVGDMVWTHRNRWRRVSCLFQKPPTPMFSLTFSNREVLTVTGQHELLLISEEWATVASLIDRGGRDAFSMQSTHAGPGIGAQGSYVLPHPVTDNTAGSRNARSEPPYSENDDSAVYVRCGVSEAKEHSLPEKQISGEESTIRSRVGVRLRGWEGVPDTTSTGQEILCTSDSICGVSRGTSIATTRGFSCAPYRREPEAQQDRQSSCVDGEGAPKDTRAIPDAGRGFTIEKVIYAGVHRVYDFQVDEDHSYLACGVFNHNSENPNGQNFPNRTELATAYRRLFVAPERHFIIGADLSQAELRIAAELSGDRVMRRIYLENGDIHIATALIVLNITIDQFYQLSKADQKLARFKAKAVNFGFLYGMGWRKFVVYAKTQYGVEFTEKEAQRIRAAFFTLYAGLKVWHDKVKAFAIKHKMVRSISGRIRHLPMIDSPDEMIRSEAERQAVNSPVQEFGSSYGVMAMGRMDEEVDPSYLALAAFVHDAIYPYVPKEYLEWGVKTVKYYMESNPIEEWFGYKLTVPMKADVSFGVNLGDLFELEGLTTDPNGIVTVGDYDFDKVWEKAPESRLILPKQKIPPNNGRLLVSPYFSGDCIAQAA